VVTCKPGLRNKLITLKEHFPDSHIIEVENRGRDIAPWLIDAAPLLAKCDYVLKIHTKATPHAPELAGWRLQLLWSLLGSTDHIRAILDNFESNKNLGLILPEYHPKLRNDIKWGNNFMLAKDVFAKIGIDIDQKTLLQPPLNFPAGSMFWYRTDALDTLLSKKGSIDDFPDEKGQTDGTIMHAIERLVCIVAKTHSFNSIFVSMYP
jgi:lipopolysaccharide biosynthesis protein